MTDDATEPESVGAPQDATPDPMPEARLGRGFFSPPDITGMAPSYEYPESASAFYTAALESLELSDAANPGQGGGLTQLFKMLDGDDDPPPTPSYPVAPPVVAPPPAPVPVHPAYPEPPVQPAYPEPPAAPPTQPPPGTAATAPVRIPAAVAPCDMCGMTVPVDPDRGRCHVGHRLEVRLDRDRKGRRGR